MSSSASRRLQPAPYWWSMMAVLLVATAFRFFAIDAAPPGWRDDELIEYGMDRRIADGWRPLFITEAEGHEPVYHYLHAGTLLLFGDNLVGYKWLPMAFGLLTSALTYALARKMFNPKVALLAAALMAVSFWPVMYARFGVRHIGTLPWMLTAMYLLYPEKSTAENTEITEDSNGKLRALSLRVLRGLLAGVCLAAGLMTYFAGRAVPIVLAGFLGYLLIFQRSIFNRVWVRYALALALGVALAAPMFIEIANTPGAEKRTEVVGGPLIELRQGRVQPALETTLGTLGMFTFAGDPESLYNVPHRPVFDWITGAFFYLGLVICLMRLKRVESGFALAWWLIGIAPAFVSVPAASFSHTIAALPVVYMLAALGAIEAGGRSGKWLERRWVSRTGRQRDSVSPSLLLSIAGSLLLVCLGGWLTIRDYFGTWANDPFVRFQYHAPTREIAQWLDQNPSITDVAIGTHITQLELDPLALELDMKRADVVARWFSPELALVVPRAGTLVMSAMQTPGPLIEPWVERFLGVDLLQPVAGLPAGLRAYTVNAPFWHITASRARVLATLGRAVGWLESRFESSTLAAGDTAIIESRWYVIEPVLRPLKSFVHVLSSDGQVVAGVDRLDVNMASLKPDDTVLQFGAITLPAELAPGEYQTEIGLYYPDSGERLLLPNRRDQIDLPQPLEVIAP